MEQEIEYHQVYEGICAVAAHCDGAVTEDGVGFNGQDTHFGRRIALVPFEAWTDDVKVEAARIANRYQVQILTYTGIDVTALQVVQEAKDRNTNHQARDDARGFERRAKGADKLALRKIDALGNNLSIHYDRKDPDFGKLLEACKSLPGRKFDWDRKCNVVPASEAVEDFILVWDFPVTDAALALLRAPKPEFFNVILQDNGERVTIDTPYDTNLVERIKKLPGRAYIGGSVNHADVYPDVLDLVMEFGLKCHPDARAALMKAEEVLETRKADELAAGDHKAVLARVSRLGTPEALPAAFVDLLEGVLK